MNLRQAIKYCFEQEKIIMLNYSMDHKEAKKLIPAWFRFFKEKTNIKEQGNFIRAVEDYESADNLFVI